MAFSEDTDKQESRKVPPAERLAGKIKIRDKVGMVNMTDHRAKKVVNIETEGPMVTYTLDNDERYTIPLMTELNFPRRPDSATVDWVHYWGHRLHSPMWYELKSGDRIPDPFDLETWSGRPWADPSYGYDDMNEEGRQELENWFIDDLRAGQLIFVRMNKPRGRDNPWAATFWKVATGETMRVRVFSLGDFVMVQDIQPELLNWVKASPGTQKKDVERQFRWAGPYRYIEDDGSLGERTAMFAIKESRGRWPKEITEYSQDGSGLMRPPTSMVRATSDPTAWSRWTLLEGGDQHPHDDGFIEKWDVTQAKLKQARETPMLMGQHLQHD